MKTFKVKPVESIGLEFEDGHIIELRFNMKAIGYLSEALKESNEALTSHSLISKIIYGGAKAVNSDFTIDEANALYVQLQESNVQALEAIMNEYCDASGIDKDELKKNLILEMMKTKQQK